MTLQHIYLILKSRIKIVLISSITFISIALLAGLIMPPKYKATATIILNYKGYDPVSGLTLPAPLMPGYMATQISILSSEKLAIDAVEKLGLDKNVAYVSEYNEAKSETSPPLKYWIAKKLLKKLSVEPAKDSGLLDIIFKSSDPEFAALVVNTFAETYIAESSRLDSEPSKNASLYLKEKIEKIKQEYDAAQKRLSETQQKLGITSVDGLYDAETSKLQSLMMQLGEARNQAIEAQSRKAGATNFGDESPDILLNPGIKELKSAISASETKLATLSNLYGKNHPLYVAENNQLDELRKEYAIELKKSKSVVANSSNIYANRAAQLEQEINQQKQKLLELNIARNQLLSLERDVITAKETYLAASQRRAASDIQGGSNQTGINILNKAIPVKEPYLPNFKLFCAAGLFIGVFVGIFIALYLEWINQKIRTSNDLELIFEIPTLSVIQNTNSGIKALIPVADK